VVVDKSFPNGGLVSIDEDRISKNIVYEIVDDIILTTLDRKYEGGILEKKVGIYGDWLDWKKTTQCSYYYKLMDRILFIDVCRQKNPTECICKMWYLFKHTKWLERNGFYEGKYLPIYYLLFFRRSDKNKLFVSQHRMDMCEYIGKKVSDDLPNQPFIYHQSKLVGDDWLMVRKWLEIITL